MRRQGLDAEGGTFVGGIRLGQEAANGVVAELGEGAGVGEGARGKEAGLDFGDQVLRVPRECGSGVGGADGNDGEQASTLLAGGQGFEECFVKGTSFSPEV